MENTSNYLLKEVQSVEQKIEYAKQLLLQELGVNLYIEEDYKQGLN